MLAASLFLISGIPLFAELEGLTYLRAVVTNEDGTGLVTGLTRDRFLITEGKHAKLIEEFSAAPQPSRVVICLHLGGSMFLLFQDPQLQSWRNAVTNGRTILYGPPDTGVGDDPETRQLLQDLVIELSAVGQSVGKCCLIGFDSKAEVLRDFGDAQPKALSLPIKNGAGKATDVSDALLLAIEKLETQGAFSSRMIILVSNGEDLSSRSSKKYVGERLRRSGIRFSNLTVAPLLSEKPSGIDGLRKYSKVTGGWNLPIPLPIRNGTGEDLLRIITEGTRTLLAELGHEYRLGFRSDLSLVERVTKVKVSVPGTDYKTRFTIAPDSPFAP